MNTQGNLSDSKIWYAGKENDIRAEKVAKEQDNVETLMQALKQDLRAKETAELNEGEPRAEGQMSFINKKEEKEAREFIEKEFLCNHRPHVTGYFQAIMIYEQGEAFDSGIIRPDSLQKRDRRMNYVGRVVLQGLECYRGPKWEESVFMKLFRKVFGKYMRPSYKQPWCKVGDWILYPRTAATYANFKGRPLHLIPDDAPLMILQNPTDIIIET